MSQQYNPNVPPGNCPQAPSPQLGNAPLPSPGVSHPPESTNTAAPASQPQTREYDGQYNSSQSGPSGESTNIDYVASAFQSMEFHVKAEKPSDEETPGEMTPDALRKLLTGLSPTERRALFHILCEDEDVKVNQGEIKCESAENLSEKPEEEQAKVLNMYSGYFTKKQRKILEFQSLENLPVIKLAGIGKALEERLMDKGYYKVKDLYERVFLLPGTSKNLPGLFRSKEEFTKEIMQICRPRELNQLNINLLQAEWCYFCLYNWHQKWHVKSKETTVVHAL